MYRRNVEQSEPVAYARSAMIKGSVQKVNLVLKAIRGKKISEVVSLLSRIQKYAAIDVRKTVLSAVANAEQNGFVDIDNLILKKVSAGKAVKLKRFQPRARGKIFSVNKHYSKIYVELHEQVEA
jgi:large subunit ribosomal protein L22